MTDLGYEEVFASGTNFRNRYIALNVPSQILGIDPDVVVLSQVSASAPLDNVLMSSAIGFTQGLYPPVGPTLGEQNFEERNCGLISVGRLSNHSR